MYTEGVDITALQHVVTGHTSLYRESTGGDCGVSREQPSPGTVPEELPTVEPLGSLSETICESGKGGLKSGGGT